MTPFADRLDFGGFDTEEMRRLYNAVYESVNKFNDTPAPEPLDPEKGASGLTEQEKFREELADFIVRYSWETMDGKIDKTLILAALEQARKFHGLQLFREYVYQTPN